MASAGIAVVGGSVAAGALVNEARTLGYDGPIAVIDEDPDAPYDRPPLSKGFLSSVDHCPPASWWNSKSELVRARAVGLDVEKRSLRLRLPDGTRVERAADQIVVATGSWPRALPGEPDCTFHLRSVADALRIRNEIRPGRKAIIVGAGTIGTELASSLVSAGCDVVLIDQAAQPLERFFAGHLGHEAGEWIRAAGVDLQLSTGVIAAKREGSTFTVLTHKGPIVGEILISALGISPAIDWLRDTALDLHDGVACDDRGRALDVGRRPIPCVYAIGDVARWCSPRGDGSRSEDWTSAQAQGRSVARSIVEGSDSAGLLEPRYLWTQQFGRFIQVLGSPTQAATLVLQDSDPRRSASFYALEEEDEPIAWIAINSPRQLSMVTSKARGGSVADAAR